MQRQINDGFAGGHLLTRNCGFNLVRETLDHGVFNSWCAAPPAPPAASIAAPIGASARERRAG
jgi:hypothetical protein